MCNYTEALLSPILIRSGLNRPETGDLPSLRSSARPGRWGTTSMKRFNPEFELMEAERAIHVSPGYVLPEVLAQVSARLTGR